MSGKLDPKQALNFQRERKGSIIKTKVLNTTREVDIFDQMTVTRFRKPFRRDSQCETYGTFVLSLALPSVR